MHFRMNIRMQTDDKGHYYIHLVVDNNGKVIHLKTSPNADRSLVYSEVLEMMDSCIASLTNARNELISDIKDSLFA